MNSQTFIPETDLFSVLDDIETAVNHSDKDLIGKAVLEIVEQVRSVYAAPKGDCCG